MAKVSDNSHDVGDGGRKPSVPAGKYVCPLCGTQIQVHINMICLPECTMHSGSVIQMEEMK